MTEARDGLLAKFARAPCANKSAVVAALLTEPGTLWNRGFGILQVAPMILPCTYSVLLDALLDALFSERFA